MGFETIIGYESEKQELMQLKSMLQHVDRYRASGVRLPRGVILCGAPGVGKSVMARALAGDGVNLMELRAADCCGDTAEAIRAAFEKAKALAPCVLLLDELDKIAGTNDDFFMESNFSVKNILLQEIDGLAEADSVLVAATCNDSNCLGDALTRTGRFDHMLTVGLPDVKTREQILEHYLNRLSLRKKCSAEYVARLTGGFSCADMECLANEAGIRVLDGGKEEITTDDLVKALNRKDFGGTEKDSAKGREDLRRVAVHEAGHAVVAMTLQPESVFGASILSQGESLGHVRMMENKDTGRSLNDITDSICIALAGRVAERTVLKKMYLGSESDLQGATVNMMALLTKEAAFGYKYLMASHPLMMNVFSGQKADELTRDFEMQMRRQDERAMRIISENRNAFDAIVNALIERKALTREELFALYQKTEVLKTA